MGKTWRNKGSKGLPFSMQAAKLSGTRNGKFCAAVGETGRSLGFKFR